MNSDIIVTDLNNKMSELLLDFFYDSFKYEYERNTSRTISFTAYMTSHNVDVYNMLQNESYIQYDGQTYVIKNTNPKMNGDIHTNEVTAHHIMYEFQNHYISTDIVNEELNSDSTGEQQLYYSLKDYLEFGFKGNKLGYSFEIKGTFTDLKPIGELGGKNGIEYLIEGAEQYGYIFFADNKKIYIYDDKTFYNPSELTIRHKYNSDETGLSINTNDLKTIITGYGKKKTKTETKNYNPTKPSDLTFGGSFIKEGTWYSETIGAYYTKTFDCKWGNETLTWSLKKGVYGGMVSVFLDNQKIGDYNTYSKSSSTDQIILKKGLSKGKHTVKVQFLGPSNNVDYKNKKPRFYVGTSKTTIFNITAVLKGTDIYHVVETHKSPNYDVFGHREAPDVFDENIKNSVDMIAKLKTELVDEPVVELSTNYIDTEKIFERDAIWFIHEVMGFDTELKVMSLTKSHPILNVPDEIGFSNNKTDIIKIQQQVTNKMKNVSNVLDRTRLNNINSSPSYYDEPIVGSVLIDG